MAYSAQHGEGMATVLEELALETVIISRKVPTAFYTEKKSYPRDQMESKKNIQGHFHPMSSGLILFP